MPGFFDKAGLGLPICIAGAGAIGITIAARLSIAGFHVRLVARGGSLAAISKQGIRLLDSEGDHRAHVEVGQATDFGPQRILFLCSKSHDLADLAAALQPLISAETIIVPVVNGIPWWYFDGDEGDWTGQVVKSVDPDGRLKRLIPSRQIVGTTTLSAGRSGRQPRRNQQAGYSLTGQRRRPSCARRGRPGDGLWPAADFISLLQVS